MHLNNNMTRSRFLKPEVSVIVAAYNQEKYILDLLKSIKIQKKKYSNIKFELIFCDNKSTDKTLEIIKKNKSNFIKIFRNRKNIGFSKNLIKALQKAKSNYVTFMGADDILFSLKNLNDIVSFQKKKKIAICF